MTRSLLLLVLCLFVCGSLSATSIPPKSLPELVAEAEHILIGTIRRVSMHGADGREISDPKAKTGPGLPNEIRLHVTLDPKGVLKTNKSPLSAEITIPLWKMWHSTFERVRSANEGKTYIFLLKGDDMGFVYPGGCQVGLGKRAEIEAFLAAAVANVSDLPAAAVVTP